MRRFIELAILCVVLFSVTGCGVEVPDTRGMTLKQATAALREAGFTVGEVSYDNASEHALWTVTEQVPQAGGRSKSGAVVSLKVAGPPPVSVPALVGATRSEAETALASSHLKLGEVTESYDESVQAGRIVSQVPNANVDAPEGSLVRVILSKGPAPVAVPSTKGQTQSAATKRLEAAGFKVRVIEAYDDAKKGTVISQQPMSGYAQPGKEIVITISKGPKLVTVPAIQDQLLAHDFGMEPGEVSSEEWRRMMDDFVGRWLRPLGLRWRFIGSDRGEVYPQSPEPGSRVPEGTVVVISWSM